MEILAIDEYNSGGHLVWAQQFPGAFVRGRTRQEAIDKFDGEMRQYLRWLGQQADGTCTVRIVQEKVSTLEISDADSDILFDSEAAPMTMDQYERLRDLALRSAADFLTLYRSVPDKDNTTLTPRKTFYGDVPITARQMYAHTKNVNGYYFGEIQVPAQNEPDILTCRLAAFAALERLPGFLINPVYEGSGGELWSLRKVCRRFVWHDRIHAKAMYRMATALCGPEQIANPFCFELPGG